MWSFLEVSTMTCFIKMYQSILYPNGCLFPLPTDTKPVFPLEAIIAAVVVILLTIIFGIVARRERIFKVTKPSMNQKTS